MTKPHLLAVGGAHIDRRGRVLGRYVPGVSNPGIVDEEVGGAAFNALRNAVRRGVTASLMSLRGGDTAGEAVQRAIAEAGIADLSAVFLDRATPSYTALLNHDGELIAGLADMGLYDMAFPKQMGRSKMREAVHGADAILCDANLPGAALSRLLGIAAAKPVFAIAISPAKAARLEDLLAHIACLFMNRREAEQLAGRAGPIQDTVARLWAKGLGAGIITAGEGPVTGFDKAALFTLAPPKARTIADVTGAGDALAGATVAAMMRGLALGEALREGLAAALLTVENRKAVADFTARAFARALAMVPDPEPL